MKRLTPCLCLSAAALLTACSVEPPPSPELAAATRYRQEGDRLARSAPIEALGPYLIAAREAWERIESQPDDQGAISIYNDAVGQVATILFKAEPDWRRKIAVGHEDGNMVLETRRQGAGLIDPGRLDELYSPSEVELPSDFERFTRDGVGIALCGRSHRKAADEPFMPPTGMVLSLTAMVRFPSAGRAVLEFHDSSVADEVVIGGTPHSLAADYSAPAAVWLDHVPKENIGWKGMVRPEAYLENMGLYLPEPYNPEKIPVILVHGLQSRPRIWARAVNTLRGDPVLRDNYQFFYFQYPTGFPIAYTSAGLRHELERFRKTFDPRRTNPRMRNMVLIGHSMGGILSNLQVRNGGEEIRAHIFRRPIEEVRIDEESKAVIRGLTDFEPNHDVRRIIFVTTPHRGSQIASGNIGKLGARLIRFPVEFITGMADLSAVELTDDARWLLDRGATSIDDLRPNSVTLTMILDLEHHDGVTFHSIIGDRGRGDTPDSSDGVVPYWSSRYQDAASERIVPTHHGATKHDETIAEVGRILHHHLTN